MRMWKPWNTRLLCSGIGAFAFFDDPADPTSTARAALEDKR